MLTLGAYSDVKELLMDMEQAVTLVKCYTWANHRVLLKAAHLTSAQLHDQTDLSYHTIMDTLVHILDTQMKSALKL